MGIRKSLWGVHNEQEIHKITLSNRQLELTLTNLGCTVVAIMLPDENGRRVNMVLGYDTLEGYLNDSFYMGCIVGRFANRISNAAFRIGDTTYNLTANEAGTGNHLHGGHLGFHKKVFRIEKLSDAANNIVRFYYKSSDGEEGYPGILDVYVTYTLTDQNEIIIDYTAATNKPTHVNLTNHCYFNLSGTNTSALNHELFIDAEMVLAADDTYIPTGELKPVQGTDLDFRKWRRIHAANTLPFPGYNDYFSFIHTGFPDGAKAGLRDRASGRLMTVKTTLPGLMLYTGDFLKAPFRKNGGICLETQFFPDSPNRPEFPPTLLQPGAVYRHQTVYQFWNSLRFGNEKS